MELRTSSAGRIAVNRNGTAVTGARTVLLRPANMRRRPVAATQLTPLLFALFLAAPSARASDLELCVAPGLARSSWERDIIPSASLKALYATTPHLGLFFLGRLGYGPVDERGLTLVSLGGEVRQPLPGWRPHLRVAAVHQHEEPVAFVGAGAVLGLGNTIRHRAGVEAGLGFHITLPGLDETETLVGVELWSIRFLNTQGPSWIGGGALSVGVGFDV